MGCGAPFTHDNHPREVQAQQFKEFIQRWCIPSRFHYTAITSLPDNDSSLDICLNCVNWRRRCVRGGHKRGNYTPVDSVLLFALEPGAIAVPDRRSFERMAHVLQDPHNMFAGLIPVPAKHAIGGTGTEPSIDAVVWRWWEENACTPFFRSSHTARAVRRCIRNRRLAAIKST